jgi:ferredoxin
LPCPGSRRVWTAIGRSKVPTMPVREPPSPVRISTAAVVALRRISSQMTEEALPFGFMPTIDFLGNAAGRGKSVEAPEGGELLAMCDRHLAPVPFSCRSATCATCHVQVLEGGELLVPPAAEERELLDVIRAAPDTRLACQVIVRAGDGRVRLRPVEWDG